MEKRQILGATILGVIAFGALAIGILEKADTKKAELAEKRRLEAEAQPEPIFEARPLPHTADAMAEEIMSEAAFEEELISAEEAGEAAGVQSDIQTINELTNDYAEENF